VIIGGRSGKPFRRGYVALIHLRLSINLCKMRAQEATRPSFSNRNERNQAMNEIKTMAGAFADDVARDLADMREAAQHAEIRTLADIEMGWVGGGDDVPIWPHN
jgi:hypothetical protein